MESTQSRPVRRFLRITLLAVLFSLLMCGGAVWYGSQLLLPPESAEGIVRISIPPGTGTSSIAEQLEQKGMIRNASAFLYYIKWKKEGAKFQAGEYDMSLGMTHDEIIEQFNAGRTVKEETIRLTVPEGFIAEQMAAKLTELGLDGEGFIALLHTPEQFASSLPGAIPEDPRLLIPMEGYLFPETYEFSKAEKPDASAIIERMLKELSRKLGSLPEDWKQVMEARGLTFHELLTAASLIEREAVLKEERALIAGVIYNRLQKPMPLQIDASVQYLFDEPKERLFHKDLQIESPYNTYLHQGLPPGPIASPSIESIYAALYPEETSYYFYVTKKDGTSGHYFSETYEQHLENIALSNKNASAQ